MTLFPGIKISLIRSRVVVVRVDVNMAWRGGWLIRLIGGSFFQVCEDLQSACNTISQPGRIPNNLVPTHARYVLAPLLDLAFKIVREAKSLRVVFPSRIFDEDGVNAHPASGSERVGELDQHPRPAQDRAGEEEHIIETRIHENTNVLELRKAGRVQEEGAIRARELLHSF